MEWLSRTELLVGKEKLSKLQKSNILIVGLGGVGAYAAEQICRAGVGNLTIVDGDIIQSSNRNRQLAALTSTESKLKTEILKYRFLDINPNLNINIISKYIKDDIIDILKDKKYDYVVDAIDTLSPKVNLVYNSLKLNYKIVSSMGAGGKLDPSKISISDISKTYNCKLARMLRKRLHKMGIYKGVQSVFSPENIPPHAIKLVNERNKKSTVGTISYMPAIFGCMCASVVINDLNTY